MNPPENKYELHEAIQIVLSDQPDLTATIEVISREIERRKLWVNSFGRCPPPYQILARGLSRRKNLFKFSRPPAFRLIGPTMKDDR